jgi:uncharacterized membrane protein
VAREKDRLDQPYVPARRLRPNVDPEAFGQWTERVARFLGTGRFLVAQTLFITVWITLNVIPGIEFDSYPFGFLTLVLSLQAAYAAPLILLAQNRQDDRDRANLVEDRQQAQRNLDDTEFVARELADVRLALGDVVTRDWLRDELADLVEELAAKGALAGGVPTPRRKKKKRKPAPVDGPTGDDVGTLTEPQQPDPAEDQHETGTSDTAS